MKHIIFCLSLLALPLFASAQISETKKIEEVTFYWKYESLTTKLFEKFLVSKGVKQKDSKDMAGTMKDCLWNFRDYPDSAIKIVNKMLLPYGGLDEYAPFYQKHKRD